MLINLCTCIHSFAISDAAMKELFVARTTSESVISDSCEKISSFTSSLSTTASIMNVLFSDKESILLATWRLSLKLVKCSSVYLFFEIRFLRLSSANLSLEVTFSVSLS